MSNTRSEVEYLVNEGFSNRQIAKKIGKTRRLVRMYANPIRRARDGVKLPKILVFDIETLPMEIYVWGLYKQRPTIDQIIKDWSVLSWSAKWLFDSKVMSDVVTAKEAINRDDKRVLTGLWKLMDEADILVAHNGKRFDCRKVNARFIVHGWKPPMSYHLIDTRIEANKHFAFSSAKLAWLTQLFKLEEKWKTEYELWTRSAQGDQEAIDYIHRYGCQDVVALEDLYVELRPWIKSHPNYGLYVDTDKEVCPNCGESKLKWRGYYYTPAGRFRAFRCNTCGAVGRSRFSDLSKAEKKKLTISVAR